MNYLLTHLFTPQVILLALLYTVIGYGYAILSYEATATPKERAKGPTFGYMALHTFSWPLMLLVVGGNGAYHVLRQLFFHLMYLASKKW